LESVRRRAESDARSRGYYLNPDEGFLKDLIEGLKRNEERYGYPSCPCRLASGVFEFDRDIVCPCDYRDPDVEEFGACYCALFVKKEAFEGKMPITPVPERRPPEKQARASGAMAGASSSQTVAAPKLEEGRSEMKLWYCKQCGYVVFREEPPYICPICKAKKEFFAPISIGAYTSR
jgi:ferredoxin-thioredoxin reductase catalytic subunit